MYTVTAVDQGWAWVALAAVFLSNNIVCVNYMCGLFAIHFANSFNQPASIIAITGALANGMFSFSGPMASFLLRTVGGRRGLFISTTITAIGFIASAFCTTFIGLCICFGVLCGAGVGMSFTISMVPLGFYFDRHRNLAYGIASSGVGFGIMVLAPITTALIERYTWHGACLIFAGMIMHYYAVALVIDPVTYTGPISSASTSSDILTQSKEKHRHQNAQLKLKLNERCNERLFHSLQHLQSNEKSSIKVKGTLGLHRNKQLAFSEIDISTKTFEGVRYKFDDVLFNISSDLISRSYLSLQTPDTVNETETQTDNQEPLSKYKESSTLDTLTNAVLIFTNIKYSLFCCNVILVCAVVSTIYNHLPTYSTALGNTETNVSLLISVIGISNISTRFFTGLITSTKCNSIHYYITLLSALSVLFAFAPIYGKYYYGQVVVALGVGGCNAFYVLMSPFVIQFVGLESLEIGFGFVLFMAGIGFLLGPPISGFIYDIAGGFSSVYIFCGAALMLSVLCMLPIPIILKKERKKVTQKIFQEKSENC